MPRKAIIDDLIIRKRHNADNMRQVIAEMAIDGERVGNLIDRAVAAGVGSRRQVRASIYLGAQSVNAGFKLERGS
jgi:hypothetical protein